MSEQFKVGDHVQWVHAVAQPYWQDSAGRILAVIPNDQHLTEFTMYDVEFEFGMQTLYGTQLELTKREGQA